MTEKFKGFYSVLLREAGRMIKDKDILTIVLLSPMFYAFFYCTIYVNKSEQEVPVAVVDYDRSPSSREFIRNVDATELVKIDETLPDLSAAKDRLYSMRAQGIMVIPKDFEKNIKKGQASSLNLVLNTSRFLISNDINRAVNAVAEEMAQKVKTRYFQNQGMSFKQSEEAKEPINYDLRALFNFSDSYGDFLVPGILIMILQQTLLIGLSESMAKEREEGTIKDLYLSSGRSILAVIAGKGAIYFLLYAAYSFFFFTVNFGLFKLRMDGDALTLVFLTAIFLTCIIYLSIFLSSFFKRKVIALQVFVFTSYPFFLMSGYPWPLSQMPPTVHALSMLLPVTPYLSAYQRISAMGAGFQDVIPQIIHLTLLAAIGIVATRIRLKFLIAQEEGLELKILGFKLNS